MFIAILIKKTKKNRKTTENSSTPVFGYVPQAVYLVVEDDIDDGIDVADGHLAVLVHISLDRRSDTEE